MKGRGGRGVSYEGREGEGVPMGRGEGGIMEGGERSVPLWGGEGGCTLGGRGGRVYSCREGREGEYEIYVFHWGVCEEDKATHIPVSGCVKGALNRAYVHYVVKILHRWGERRGEDDRHWSKYSISNYVFNTKQIFRRTKCYHYLTNCILTIFTNASKHMHL